jgi:hypothetical protein
VSTERHQADVKGITNMRQTTIMTILAMGLALAVGRADVHASTSLASPTRVGGEAMTAMKNSDEPQKPVQADQEKQPLLVAPGGCATCRSTDSLWDEFKLAVSRIFWI